MPSFPVEPAATSLKGKLPEELPHGLILPPPFVREIVAAKKEEFGPAVYTPEAEERALNEHTLQFYYDQLGYEVLYHETPDGPEVLAVGYDEMSALTDGMRPERMDGLKTWMP